MKKCFLLVWLFSLMGMFAAERLVLPDEIAYYPLQEGTGTVVKEINGRMEDGKALRTFWGTCEGINVLDFGGMKNSRTAAIDMPSVDFDGEFSIAIWVYAFWWKENWAPIFYKGDKSFGLRNNQNHPGQLFFLIRDPNLPRSSTLVSGTSLLPRRWYHVVVSFKPGAFMRIYLDGRLDAEKVQNVPKSIGQDTNRCRMGGPVKPGKNSTDFFAGYYSNLHLYKRALTQEDIIALRNSENHFDTFSGAEDNFPANGKIVAKISSDMDVFESGAIQFRAKDGSCFRLDSSYSYPHSPQMGYNYLTAAPMKNQEAEWKPAVTTKPDGSVVISAKGSSLELTRVVTALDGRRFRVQETFHNPTDKDQAVLFQHQITPIGTVASWAIGGEDNACTNSDGRILPSNPTGFIATPSSSVAWVVEDDIFRCHQTVSVQERKNQPPLFQFGCRKIGVPAGKSHTLEYTLYLLPTTDYFDFINQLRADWKVPLVTMPGPFGLIRTAAQSSGEYRKYAQDMDAFKKVMARKKMNVITLNPWFNYWDGNIFNTREEYKANMQEAMKVIRGANPDAKFLASLETYVFELREADFADIPAAADFSWTKVTPATTERVKKSLWNDSATYDSNGKIVLYPETAVENGKNFKVQPALHLMVHPVVGNHFFKHRMEEYDFLLNDVGLDGIYQDMFGFSAPNNVICDQWDGFTVSIETDGTIGRKFTHLGPLTAPARAIWLKKILGMNKIALTNFGAPTTREMQTIPFINFCEAAGRNLATQNLDAIPPISTGCAMNQLSTPLAYGPHKSEEIDAQQLMKRVRAYLRHGCLYVHTSFRNRFPEEGPQSGEYGPVNHMFPITVTELHRGWVKGQERIVSCVSFETTWNRQEKPVALRFDAVGRDKEPGQAATITGTPGNWNVSVKIDDWQEFLILE